MAPLTKLLPLTVKAIALLPALAEFGVRDERMGTGFGGTAMVNASAPDVPPPGGGLTTFTCAVPAVVRSLAGIEALNSEAEAEVVTFETPFH